jgi:hypothetical protein
MYKQLMLTIVLCILSVVSGQAQDLVTLDPEVDAIITRLQQTPGFINFTTERVKTIYTRGLALGKRPQVFTKMGDSDTDQGAFLRPLGMGAHPGY